jgi:hypothetical protein
MLTPAFFPSLERHDTASRTEPFSQLTDDQWFLISDSFPWEGDHRFLNSLRFGMLLNALR